MSEGLDIEWLWVKGHSNDKYNDMADAIANEAIKKGFIKQINTILQKI